MRRLLVIFTIVYGLFFLCTGCQAITEPEYEQPLDSPIIEPHESDSSTNVNDKAEIDSIVSTGIASSDPIISNAWELIKQAIEYYHQLSGIIILDAEITRLECSDRFETFYDDKIIEAYALEYRLLLNDPSQIELVGAIHFDNDGWLLGTSSMGNPWLIFENQDGILTYIDYCYPMGEGRGVPLTTLHMLMDRDIEQGLNIAQLALLSVQYSIAPYIIFERDIPTIAFEIPVLYSQPEDWNIIINGRLSGDSITTQISTLSLTNKSDESTWQPGDHYALLLENAVYEELQMLISLPQPDENDITIKIDLLPYLNE